MKRCLILPFAFAAFLCGSAPSLMAQAPAATAEHASPGDHGQDRDAVPVIKNRALHEVSSSPRLGDVAPPAEHPSHESELKMFGMGLGSTAQWIIQVINLLIFGGALWYLVKGPVKSAFANYRKDLEDRLAQAEKDKAEGEAQIKELEAKMAGLQAELGDILAKASAEAEAEKRRVLESAKVEAAAILAATEAEITRQQQLASQGLRELVAELAVEAATRRLEIRVQGATAQAVTDDAIAELGGAK